MLKYKLKSSLLVVSGGALVFSSIAIWKNDLRFYKSVMLPIIHQLDPETSHRLAILSSKWAPSFFRSRQQDDEILKTKLWNLSFSNPIGLAAGFDKHGEAVPGLFGMGFGFVEVGSVTPQPQEGNPKPRVFRLTQDKAVINRYGFNSQGHDICKKNLEMKNNSSTKLGILAINLGQNKLSKEAWPDYVDGIQSLGRLADFLVINISSPNTPGLRSLQKRKALEDLLDKVLEARNSLNLSSSKKIPVLIKIAPDLSFADVEDVAKVILDKKLDGVVVCNTTIARPETLQSPLRDEIGGLSGAPLRHVSTEMIRQFYILTKGSVPIIGVGGVETGQDAYDKIRAGASLIELYTALVYEGPPIVAKIKYELTNLIKNDGFSSVSQAIGADHEINQNRSNV